MLYHAVHGLAREIFVVKSGNRARRQRVLFLLFGLVQVPLFKGEYDSSKPGY
jgi:hypothetical protein